MMYLVPNNMLYHHGILGQKWGIRRFQPYGQGYAGSKGKFVGKKKKIEKEEPKKMQVKREDYEALEEERMKKNPSRSGLKDLTPDEKKFIEDRVEKRTIDDIIRRGIPSEIAKYATKMNNQQLEQATKRIELNKKLSHATTAEKNAGWNAINKTMNKVGDVNKWGNTALNSGRLIKDIIEFFDEIGMKTSPNNSSKSNKK